MEAIRSRASDETLVEGIARGDELAFEEFYRRYLPAVTGYFQRRLADRELSFDLTAETFAAAIESSSRFRAKRGRAAAWLFGIAHNKLVTSYRRGRVESEARGRLGFDPIALVDDDLDRVDELTSASDEAELARALAELPEESRAAIVSRVVDERPYAEIAADMTCSEALVRQRVSRGLRDLRLRMEGAE